MNTTYSRRELPFRRMTDTQLVEHADLAVRKEHASIVALLDALAEIDRRSLYLGQGYSSLFDFCTRRWNYSPATAGRYIAAARTAARFPQIRKLLGERRLTVCGAARLASTLNAENCDALTRKAADRTFAEVEALVQVRRTAPRVPDRVRMIGTAPVAMPKAIPIPLPMPMSVSLPPMGPSMRAPGTSHSEVPPARSDEPDRYSTRGAHTGNDEVILAATHSQRGSAMASPGAPLLDGAVHADNDDATVSATRSQRGRAMTIIGATGDPTATRAPDAALDRGVIRGPEETLDAPAPHPESKTNEPRCQIPREIRYEIRFAARQKFVEKLERAKAVCSNKADLETVLERALDDLLDRRDPERRSQRRLVRRAARTSRRGSSRPPERTSAETHASISPVATQPRAATCKPTTVGATSPRRTRHIPTALRDTVFQRDGGQCTYVGNSGVRCAARVFLQFDHVVPYGKGGTHTEDNLRLRCGRHNRGREDLGGGCQ
ncbi:MAG: HNH endonuclease signature motif containing protein [Candidatus Eisenbacteria bacterium]